MRKLTGRRKIKTDELNITRDNVYEVLSEALFTHEKNRSDITYLWKYYRGNTPIMSKEKEFRDNINNIVCEMRAVQIVEFYQGYIFGEPVQYIRRGENEGVTDEICALNDIMYGKGKTALDDELAEWMLVCGVCPRMVLPSKTEVFDMYTLDPRYAFNVYGNALGEPVVMSVSYVEKSDLSRVYSVYTKDTYFRIENDKVVEETKHVLGQCPITEYYLNNVRMGVFEPVITLLDAIDTLQSNRIDDVQQFVNSILLLIGTEISEETMQRLQEWGALSLPEGSDGKYLTAALSQNDVQTLKNDLMSAVTEVTGMPNRNGGSSTSDTGSAVLLRDGWEIADAKAKRIENQFKKAERSMLRLCLRICSGSLGTEVLDVSDVEVKFTRRNYEAIATKSSVLISMLNCNKIHPELAFTSSGMFPDPLAAYHMSEAWVEKNKKEALQYVEDNNGQAGAGDSEGAAGSEEAKEGGEEE